MKKKKNNFFTELGQRWKTPLGIFWKKIRTFSITIGGSAAAILLADSSFNLQSNYGLPPILFTICGYVIVFCAALGLTSQITTKHPEDFDDD